MDCHKWLMLETVFDSVDVKPIVAVVPDNHDPVLNCTTRPDPLFWTTVRRWQAKGWTIGMHGYTHVMHRCKGKHFVPLHDRSEFVDLEYEQQANLIRASWRCFISQNIEPTIWVAPAHSFDKCTLRAIRDETSIRIVSDGIARDQYFAEDFYWIPQQLWSLAEKSSGLWTVCLHPNTMSDEDIFGLRRRIEEVFKARIVSVTSLSFRRRGKTPADRISAMYFWQRQHIQQLMRKTLAVFNV
jgi:hypothetical protein